MASAWSFLRSLPLFRHDSLPPYTPSPPSPVAPSPQALAELIIYRAEADAFVASVWSFLRASPLFRHDSFEVGVTRGGGQGGGEGGAQT